MSAVSVSLPSISPAVAGPGTITGAGDRLVGNDTNAVVPTDQIFAQLLYGQVNGLATARATPLENGLVPQTDVKTARDATVKAAVAEVADTSLAALLPMLVAQMVLPAPPVAGSNAARSAHADTRLQSSNPGDRKGENSDGSPTSQSVTPFVPSADISSNAVAASGNSGSGGTATITPLPANVALKTESEAHLQGGDTNPVAAAQPESATPFQTMLASAQSAGARNAAAPSEASAARMKMESTVGSPSWGREFGEKVTWMVGRQESQASVVLNPPRLGRIEISISINGDQANALFVSQNPGVRDALEQALPRLREMMADAGVRLEQAQVGTDSRSPQGDERRDNRNAPKSPIAEFAPAPLHTVTTQWLHRGNGLVDTFA